MACPLHKASRRLTGPFGLRAKNREGNARGRNRQEGPVRRRGTTARERNCLSEQKLARSAHLPQKLATKVVSARLRRIWVPANHWSPGSPIFLDCCKIIQCSVSIQLLARFENGETGGVEVGKKFSAMIPPSPAPPRRGEGAGRFILDAGEGAGSVCMCGAGAGRF
jgi:hypothetical protein